MTAIIERFFGAINSGTLLSERTPIGCIEHIRNLTSIQGQFTSQVHDDILWFFFVIRPGDVAGNEALVRRHRPGKRPF